MYCLSVRNRRGAAVRRRRGNANYRPVAAYHAQEKQAFAGFSVRLQKAARGMRTIDPLRSLALLDNGRSQSYSINSSALPNTDSGIVRPSAFAVLTLMTNSNLLGCSIGMSPAFAPLRILSAMTTARVK